MCSFALLALCIGSSSGADVDTKPASDVAEKYQVGINADFQRVVVDGAVLADKPDILTGKQMADRQSILAFKRLQGEQLRNRYGAHALGIGWRRIKGKKTGELALIFYVVSSTTEPATLIPPYFDFQRDDKTAPIKIPTTVVETPPAQEESL